MRRRLLQLLTATMVGAASVACAPQPTEPGTPLPVQPLAPPPPGIPASPAPAVDTVGIIGVFERVTPSVFPGTQRYVFRSDTTFTLYYSHISQLEGYGGRFSRTGDGFELVFQHWSEGHASASLHGDSLVVRYNLFMLMTDFEDGLYIRR
jgi:hypothetical protein